MNIDNRYKPDAEYKYFLFDPEGDGIRYYKSVEDRNKAAEDAIEQYLDDGWDENVDRVSMGEVTHVATQTDVEYPEGKIDSETGEDEAGNSWPTDWDYKCNYKMLPLQFKLAKEVKKK